MGWGHYSENKWRQRPIECLLYILLFPPQTCPEWKAEEDTEAQKGDHMPRTCGTGKPLMSHLFLVSLAGPVQPLVALCSKDFLGLEVTSSLF